MISLLIYLSEGSSPDFVKSYLCKEFIENQEIIDILLLDEWQTKSVESLTTDRYLPVAIGRGIVAVPLRSIVYIEKALRFILVHTEDGKVLSYYGKFENAIPFLDQYFWQCHKSYIVNLRMVAELHRYYFLLDSGESLPVSQKKYQRTKLYFNNFIQKPFLRKGTDLLP